jgi:hypothetical protein
VIRRNQHADFCGQVGGGPFFAGRLQVRLVLCQILIFG